MLNRGCGVFLALHFQRHLVVKRRNVFHELTRNIQVEPSAFASGAAVNAMLKEMEELFAARFERGDKKRALNRLRVGPTQKSHHFSTFRSGMWLGLAAPAVVAGFILCESPAMCPLRHTVTILYRVLTCPATGFQEDTRQDLPAWNILLFIYSILLIPTLFVLLIGLNVLVWAQERINYAFIFG
ncbi:hypothetical protein BV22DRAFT_1015396 [Leucogyrophana mollusca]|uniref:Uncharacterized protein n=1 Tax=Leucogyrophana mollusca TaxID=85980 RepID=A0ACB8BCA5_9AGAM|nr:hypothetical protein BV22DRAFT_1015396 [Leucogyrophana mollusca]